MPRLTTHPKPALYRPHVPPLGGPPTPRYPMIECLNLEQRAGYTRVFHECCPRFSMAVASIPRCFDAESTNYSFPDEAYRLGLYNKHRPVITIVMAFRIIVEGLRYEADTEAELASLRALLIAGTPPPGRQWDSAVVNEYLQRVRNPDAPRLIRYLADSSDGTSSIGDISLKLKLPVNNLPSILNTMDAVGRLVGIAGPVRVERRQGERVLALDKAFANALTPTTS
jgi:hypothetical protein